MNIIFQKQLELITTRLTQAKITLSEHSDLTDMPLSELNDHAIQNNFYIERVHDDLSQINVDLKNLILEMFINENQS